MRNDVLTGMFFSNLVMYFIVLTAAPRCTRTATQPSRPHARPLKRCGLWPALGHTGCSAWACSAAAARGPGIGRIVCLRHRGGGRLGWYARGASYLAHGFYGVIAVAMALGAGPGLCGNRRRQNAFLVGGAQRSLQGTLLVLVVLLTSRADVMGEHRNGALLRWLGWTCAGVMLLATVIMLATAATA